MKNFFFFPLIVFIFGCSSASFSPSKKDLTSLSKSDITQVWIPLDANKLNLFDDGNAESLFQALQESIRYYKSQPNNKIPFVLNETNYPPKHLLGSLCLLEKIVKESTAKEIEPRLKENFDFFVPRENIAKMARATGYYTPTVKGSLARSRKFSVPVYAQPADLKTLDLGLFRSNLKSRTVIYRLEKGEVLPYYSRKEINEGALRKKAKVLVWLEDKVDFYFLQVQGSGIVDLGGGKSFLLTYAGSNGADYLSIGNKIVQDGDLKPEEVSMQSIKQILKENPNRMDEVLNYSPSYVFFDTNSKVDKIYGSLALPLTAERSVAMDPNFYPKAMPIFIRTTINNCTAEGICKPESKYFQRIVFNQDSGGAIRGYGRIDLYFGRSAYAEAITGKLASPVEILLFLAKKESLEKQKAALDTCTVGE